MKPRIPDALTIVYLHRLPTPHERARLAWPRLRLRQDQRARQEAGGRLGVIRLAIFVVAAATMPAGVAAVVVRMVQRLG
jgi:hypothetical protein